MTFHFVLSTFLSFEATSLQYMRMEFSYHNSYVMLVLAVTTTYADFLYQARLLTIRLLEHGYVAARLKSSLQKFYSRHNELIERYGVSICTMKTDLINVS